MGAELIAWTVRLGMLCFVAVLAGWSYGTRGQPAESRMRMLWTVGWGLMLSHFLAAFHFQHDWSHAHAVAETVRQTRELFGWEFGGGVYFNYVFLVVWGWDVALWWRGQETASWYRPLRRVLIGYLIFIAFNGVVVFKEGWLRWAGLAASAAILGGWCWRRVQESGCRT